MLRKLVLGAVALGTSLCIGTAAHAVVATTNADVHAIGATTPVAPIEDVIELGYTTTGVILTNTFDNVANVEGAQIRTVGAVVFNQTDILGGPNGVNGVRDPNDSDNQIIAIFGLRGTVVSIVGGQAIASFDPGDGGAGKIGYFPLDPAFSFDRDDASTWDFDLDAILGEFAVTERQTVISGPDGQNIGGVHSSIVNLSAANLVAGGEAQGRFLAAQTVGPDAADPFDTTDADAIDPLFLDFDAPPDPLTVPDPALPLGGQVFFTDQEIENPTSDLSAANQATLNAIGQWAFGGEFANFGSAGDDDWLPDNVAVTGDFQAQLSMQSNPVIEVGVIPEPMTAGLSLLGLAGLAFASRRRRLA